MLRRNSRITCVPCRIIFWVGRMIRLFSQFIFWSRGSRPSDGLSIRMKLLLKSKTCRFCRSAILSGISGIWLEERSRAHRFWSVMIVSGMNVSEPADSVREEIAGQLVMIRSTNLVWEM